MNGYEVRTKSKKMRIQRSALKLFDKFGYESVSVRRIAEEAKVSKASVYNYYGSKENLYKEVIISMLEDIKEQIQEIAALPIDFHEKFKKIVLKEVEFMTRASGEFMMELFSGKNELINVDLHDTISNIFYRFFDEGKSLGYIEQSYSNEFLYEHVKILYFGLRQCIEINPKLQLNDEFIKKSLNLFFYGIMKKNWGIINKTNSKNHKNRHSVSGICPF